MDLLAQGSAWLQATRTQYATQCVTYLRGASAVTVPATIGRTGYEQSTEDGLTVRAEVRDYLINVADLVLDDVPAQPKQGDRIAEGDPATGRVFEVMSGAGEGPWRYSDAYRTVYRIHAKAVGTAGTPIP
jgi:hypothetical protein